MSESNHNPDKSKNKWGLKSTFAAGLAAGMVVGTGAFDSLAAQTPKNENQQHQTEVVSERKLDTTMLREALGDNPIVIKENYEKGIKAIAEFINENNSEGGHLYVTIEEPVENTDNEFPIQRAGVFRVTIYFENLGQSSSFDVDKGLVNQGKTPRNLIDAAVLEVSAKGLPAQVWFNDPNQEFNKPDQEFQEMLKNAVKFSQQNKQSKPADQQNLSPQETLKHMQQMKQEIEALLGKTDPAKFVFIVNKETDEQGLLKEAISIVPIISPEEAGKEAAGKLIGVSKDLDKILQRSSSFLEPAQIQQTLKAAGIEQTNQPSGKDRPLYE